MPGQRSSRAGMQTGTKLCLRSNAPLVSIQTVHQFCQMHCPEWLRSPRAIGESSLSFLSLASSTVSPMTSISLSSFLLLFLHFFLQISSSISTYSIASCCHQTTSLFPVFPFLLYLSNFLCLHSFYLLLTFSLYCSLSLNLFRIKLTIFHLLVVTLSVESIYL